MRDLHATRWVATGAVLSLFLTLTLPSCRTRPHLDPFQARVVGITDGDTIVVLEGSTQSKVRLNGIDCPEKGQAFGSRAKQLASDLAFGKTVTVRPTGRDRNRRILADVELPDGRFLSRELVAAGLAWHYTKYSKDEELARLERRAREARLGLWSEPEPVPPWDFRKARTGKVPRVAASVAGWVAR